MILLRRCSTFAASSISIRNSPARLRATACLTAVLALFAWAAVPGSACALGPDEIAVIVNERDPLSIRIAEYYQQRRGIPADAMVRVDFPGDDVRLEPAEFERIKAKVDAATPKRVQAYVLTWAKPYRVACMSIGTAFATGFDKAFCAKGCRPTKPSPYYNSDSTKPFEDHGIRPTMALAATTIEGAAALIDRGIASDGTHPPGTGYLVQTKDKNRNTRAALYGVAMQLSGRQVQLEHVKANFVSDKTDVLFYFTGIVNVPRLDSNRFRPGAIADHLTSAGGKLTDSRQMSSLRWLEAGATGSYGTVVEPCSFPQKFPDPAVVINRYVQGETLIEAYWKSVAWPGQGLFIGEPLARPFGNPKPN